MEKAGKTDSLRQLHKFLRMIKSLYNRKSKCLQKIKSYDKNIMRRKLWRRHVSEKRNNIQ